MRLRSGRTLGVTANAPAPAAQPHQDDVPVGTEPPLQRPVQANAVHFQPNSENPNTAMIPHYNQADGSVAGMQHYNNGIVSVEVDVDPSSYRVELPPSAEEQIERMVGAFCSRTETLAGEHAILLARQQQQAQNQEEAIHAVHASAQHNVEQLAGHQRATELSIHNALVETRNLLLGQLRQLAKDQNDCGNAIRFDVDQKLRQVLHEAQASAQAMVNEQAKATLLVEERLATALNQAHAELCSRIVVNDNGSSNSTAAVISEQLEARLGTLHEAISEQVEGIVLSALNSSRGSVVADPSVDGIAELVTEATEDVETRIERRMRLALQQSHVEFVSSFEDKARARETTMRRDMEALVHVTSDEAEGRIEEKLRNALFAAQDVTRKELKHQADETSILRTRMDAHEVNVHSRLDSFSSRVTTIERALSTSQSTFGLVSRLNALEKKVHATKSFEERLEALEKRSMNSLDSTPLQARVSDVEMQLANNLQIGAVPLSGSKKKEAAVASPVRDIMEAEMNTRISAALANATASIDALAARYANDAESKAMRLEERIMTLLGITKKQTVPQPRHKKRPTRRLTKQEVIAAAQREVQLRAETAAARYKSTAKPQHRIIVQID